MKNTRAASTWMLSFFHFRDDFNTIVTACGIAVSDEGGWATELTPHRANTAYPEHLHEITGALFSLG